MTLNSLCNKLMPSHHTLDVRILKTEGMANMPTLGGYAEERAWGMVTGYNEADGCLVI